MLNKALMKQGKIVLAILFAIFLVYFVCLNINHAYSKIETSGDTMNVFTKELKIYQNGGEQTIANYNAKNLDWSQINTVMANNTKRLLTEYAQPWDGNLNNLNPNNRPEGGVWKYTNGDLHVSGQISGKGTIIVTSGNLYVDGDLYYPTGDTTSSVGFIMSNGGSIIINSSVKQTVGAYSTTGTIEFN